MTNLIVIDLDNTLVDRVAAFRKWATQFDTQHVDALEELDKDGLRPRSEFFEMASEITATPAQTIRDNYLSQYPKQFTLDPAIAEALTNLRRSNKVVIATNGPPFQEDVIRHTGLDQLVDAWAVSEIETYRKPDARILECIITQLDQTKIVIGDGLADIELAHNLQARSIWIDRNSKWNEALHFKPTETTNTTIDALRIAHAWSSAIS